MLPKMGLDVELFDEHGESLDSISHSKNLLGGLLSFKHEHAGPLIACRWIDSLRSGPPYERESRHPTGRRY